MVRSPYYKYAKGKKRENNQYTSISKVPLKLFRKTSKYILTVTKVANTLKIKPISLFLCYLNRLTYRLALTSNPKKSRKIKVKVMILSGKIV